MRNTCLESDIGPYHGARRQAPLPAERGKGIIGLSENPRDAHCCSPYKHLIHMALIIRCLSSTPALGTLTDLLLFHTARAMSAHRLKEDEVLVDNPRKVKSDVWNHFGFVKSLTTGVMCKTHVVCKTCNHRIAYTSNTTNMSYHVKKFHVSKTRNYINIR